MFENLPCWDCLLAGKGLRGRFAQEWNAMNGRKRVYRDHLAPVAQFSILIDTVPGMTSY
jgi:hypothetical protein